MTVGSDEQAPNVREIFPIDNPSLNESEKDSIC